MQVRYRRAKPNEIFSIRHLLEPDLPLLCASVWERLPEILEDLRERDRILLCIGEDTDRGKVIFVGGSGFLQSDFLEAALKRKEGLMNAALLAELNGGPAFSNFKQIAEANRKEELRLLNFLGVPNWVDFNEPNAAGVLENLAGDPVLTSCMEAWNFFHRGFRACEVWVDSALPLMIQVFEYLGSRLRQERRLPNGQTAKLLCYTREQAVETWPTSFFGAAMLSPPPRFGFTRAEQKLLELVLLDRSDREAAAELGSSPEAIKKRWRSVYSKIAKVEPALLRRDLAPADQRRTLLQSLRVNMQELRPY